MAWAYTRYVKDPHLYVLQREAKGAKRGLWAEASPMPPEFRKQEKNNVRAILTIRNTKVLRAATTTREWHA
jgi:endonuclease YncB( thermonuclease family)